MNEIKQILLVKYRNITWIALAVWIILFLAIKIILPGINDIWQQRDTLKNEQEKLVKLDTKAKLLESISTGDMLENFVNADSAIPSEKDATSIIVSLGNISSQTHFTIDNINLNPGIVSTGSAKTGKDSGGIKNNAQVLKTSIAAKGASDQIYSFLKLLQESKRIFDIESISVGFGATKSDLVSANISLVMYYLPPLTQIGSIDSDLPQITPVEKEALAKVAQYPNLSLLPEVSLPVASGSAVIRTTDLFSQ